MTATISILPGVQDALVAQIGAAIPGSAYPDTQVTLSHPGQDLPAHVVYLGQATASEDIPVARGPNRVSRQEEWDQEIIVSVGREGADVGNARSDAFGIYGVIENVLATNATLGVDGVFKVTPHAMHYKLGFEEGRKGWGVLLTITVRATGRLY